MNGYAIISLREISKVYAIHFGGMYEILGVLDCAIKFGKITNSVLSHRILFV